MSFSTISHLLASVDPRLSFMAHSCRRNSELFFKLFNIELLRIEGFSRRSFIPPISMPKPIPHEKKLKELNMVNGMLYATSIRPHRGVTLGDVDVGACSDADAALDARCLVTFAYWLNLVGKQPASKKMQKMLGVFKLLSSFKGNMVLASELPIQLPYTNKARMRGHE
ncbi:hypothetical protein Y032_0190g1248 [Ancylostoma ceylanicum]|uniref:Uncharacterized protein n=1 Tax=Ancylostoma ceylanicum TaxID=53326 RepID=A0A016SR03_9BILA|nr:hypothetical protein Y032_0190g1248 [Ancylostoma ceylanicum]